MSRPPYINSVFRIDLADWSTKDGIGYDYPELDRHMRFDMDRIPAGTNVRLIVHRYRPLPGYTSWLRSDLNVQIEYTDYAVFLEWFEALTDNEVAA